MRYEKLELDVAIKRAVRCDIDCDLTLIEQLFFLTTAV